MGNRPTIALIDRKAIEHNYGQLRKLVSGTTKMMAVVKANAYGHGDVEVSKVLEGLGCEYLGVAICEEGVRLRQAGIKVPIVVLGGVYPSQVQDCFEFDLTPVIFDSDTAALLNQFAIKKSVKKKIHLKIDTGMGRLGLLPHHVVKFFQEFRSFDGLEVEGVLSHFAEVEEEDKAFSKKQLDMFLKVLGIIEGLGYDLPCVHMANSAAIVDYIESHFNLIRSGIMIYGAYPHMRFKDKVDLKPVMQLKTQILQAKNVPTGSPVSYGRTFVTRRESLIATIPIGYGDGLPRRLSSNAGQGEALVKGVRAPIVGTVCMDLTMLDVTGVEGVRAGDEVVIIGRQGEEEITVDEVAEKAGTIPYEILCNISARVPRLAV
ncbi:MAG: alanine racemase [Thermodesulfobacteriota bacterium]